MFYQQQTKKAVQVVSSTTSAPVYVYVSTWLFSMVRRRNGVQNLLEGTHFQNSNKIIILKAGDVSKVGYQLECMEVHGNIV